ncbi:MAG TPA: TraR/DksA C4-type zinc finger protein [Polyangiales bacterium]|nr:TraR/DksA C4-type zinc finger protein [Polyangiales bacterium]
MGESTNEAGLKPTELETLKQKLLAARRELVERRAGQLRARTGLVAEVEDEGDQASRANDEDRLTLLAETEHARLGEIDHALAKFDTGEYGLDEETGEPIGYPRLAVIPWARFSASTQEELDRRRSAL